MARREELGHPLGTVTSSTDEEPAAAGKAAAGPASPELFVLEVGSEELPPDDVLTGMAQLR
jgi:glycyl-tRNA synthetase